jgi:hypothetical protein
MTGFDSKRQAALNKLFEVENELVLSYEPEPKQEPVAWMNKHGDCKSAVFREAEAGAKEEYNIPLYTNQTLEKNT